MKKQIYLLFLILGALNACSDSNDDIVTDKNSVANTVWTRPLIYASSGITYKYESFEFSSSGGFTKFQSDPNGVKIEYLKIGKYVQNGNTIVCSPLEGQDFPDYYPKNEFTLLLNPEKGTLNYESLITDEYTFVKQ